MAGGKELSWLLPRYLTSELAFGDSSRHKTVQLTAHTNTHERLPLDNAERSSEREREIETDREREKER